MLEKSIGLLFFLKRRQNQGVGSVPIYLRITVSGDSREISLKRSWTSDRWNAHAGRATGTKEDARQLNTYLDTIYVKIQEVRRKLIESNKTITAELIKIAFSGKDEEQRTVLSIFLEHNLRMKNLVGKDYSPRTLQRFETTLTHIRGFMLAKYLKSDLNIKELDYDFLDNFGYWLKTTQKCNHNTAMKYLSNFKKIVLRCVRAKWLDADPFNNFKISLDEVNKDVLSEDELGRLYTKQLCLDRLVLVRNIFLFSCYTGLAYADVSNLNHSDIQPGVDGQKWIFINRQKTNTLSRIPLLPFANKLMNKYKEHPKCQLTGKVFPVLSNQKMNAYLKEIASMCGIVKNLTYHTARHTFATTITLSNGVPIETVADMLGHKSLKQTQHYAKLVDRRISDDMELLRTKLNLEPVSTEELNRTVKAESNPSSLISSIKYNYVIKQ